MLEQAVTDIDTVIDTDSDTDNNSYLENIFVNLTSFWCTFCNFEVLQCFWFICTMLRLVKQLAFRLEIKTVLYENAYFKSN